MRLTTLAIFAAMVLSTGCDRDTPPAATPDEPVATDIPGPDEPPVQKRETRQTVWLETLQKANDESAYHFERVGALQRYVDDAPQDDPHRDEARRLIAIIQTTSKVRGARVDAHRTVLRLPRTTWENDTIRRAGLTGVVEVLLLDFLLACKRDGPTPAVGPFSVESPFDDSFEVVRKASLSAGVGHAGNFLAEVLKRASDLPGTPHEWDGQMRNPAFNALLRPHLGGDLFDTKNEGRLNKGPAQRLARKAKRLMKREYFGLGVDELALVVEPTLRVYDRSWIELKKYGLEKGLEEYRAAYEADEDFYYWHRNWVRNNGIAEAVGVDSYYSAVAVGFWLRRLDDGTAKYWRGLLDDVIGKLPKEE